MFGAEAAYDLACRIETLARTGNVRDAAEPCERLEQALEVIHRELAAFARAPSLTDHH